MAIQSLPIFREDGTLREHYLYLLTCRDSGGALYVKVGYTINPDDRIPSLLVGCPIQPVSLAFAAIPHGIKPCKIEGEVHKSLNGVIARGEWFRTSAESPLQDPLFQKAIRKAFSRFKLKSVDWSIVDLVAYAKRAASVRAFMAAKQRAIRRNEALMAQSKRDGSREDVERVLAMLKEMREKAA